MYLLEFDDAVFYLQINQIFKTLLMTSEWNKYGLQPYLFIYLLGSLSVILNRLLVSSEAKQQVLANLANFAYDPKNTEHLLQLQVPDLFLDMLTEENEDLVEFGMGEFQPDTDGVS